MNRIKTVMLLATLTAVLSWAGAALGGHAGLLTALVFAGSRSSDECEEGGSHPLAGLLGILVATITAVLIQAAISRSREFVADEVGAQLFRNPGAWRARSGRSRP